MNRADDFDRLRLIRSANVGPVTYRQLLQRFGTAASALAALPDLARQGGARMFSIANPDTIAREMEIVARLHGTYLFLGEPGYPAMLEHIGNAPAALICSGNIDVLTMPLVSMVGARNASAAAVRFTRELARDLADHGLIVVSGLARGIDTAAHVGAGPARTIGVIAGGIDIVYPPENAELQRQIAANGLIIAEQPPGTEPVARHFPHRNRIIAGLSLGTLVVEASPRSGSLITARLANEYGREVMAIPGSPLDPRSRGCNGLIREGAILVQSAEDIIDQIRPIADTVQRPVQAVRTTESVFDGDGSSPDQLERDQVIELLSMTPVSVDEIVRQSGVSAGQVQMILLELELAGRLDRHAGAKVSTRSL